MAGNRRVIFIHGIGGKPERSQYLKLWTDALRLSVEIEVPDSAFSMAYWAHLRGEAAGPDHEQEIVRELSETQRGLLARSKSGRVRQLPLWERLWNRIKGGTFETVDPLIQRFLDRHIDDVYNYFYREGRRRQIRAVLEDELARARGPGGETALISHSMGTVIALDVLKDHRHPIDLLVTMGSPLGLAWLQHQLGDPGFPTCVGRWLNVFDRHDPVTLPDQYIADDFPRDNGGGAVQDHLIRDNYSNPDESNRVERDAHHWHGYLSSCEVGAAVRQFWN